MPKRTRKAAIRATVRVATRADRSPTVVRKAGPYADPTLCVGCGAVYTKKTWRRGRADASRLAHAAPALCPACRQLETKLALGRVVLRGPLPPGNELEILRRIANVASRAAFTQPEHRIVEVRRDEGGVEVATTSQKLAHRIARELEKAFAGRATYSWSDSDGGLVATWEREGPALRR
ncbi:MAG: hypothetical protein U0166_09355 [Acidobacteriota bacterium]